MTPVVQTEDPVPDPALEDRCFYGFRHVYRTQPSGSQLLVTVPLTRDDVLHPQEGDHIINNTLHDVLVAYLRNVLRAALAHDSSSYVFCDCKVEWDDDPPTHHAPDLAVVFGLRPRTIWQEFRVAEEGTRPTLIMEVTSKSTRSTDLNDMVQEYWEAQVPYYVIVDLREHNDVVSIQLIPYRRGATAFERIPLDQDGRLRLDLGQLRIVLGIEGERVWLYDPDTGVKIGDYTEVSQALEVAEQQLQQKTEALTAAEERIRTLEAELRRRHGET